MIALSPLSLSLVHSAGERSVAHILAEPTQIPKTAVLLSSPALHMPS
jgi:hypothetical protein